METEFLLPDPDNPLTQPFWAGCAAGELRLQRFAGAARMWWPPRVMDPDAHTTEHEWVPVSGRGTIYSYVVPHPPLLPAYEALGRYNVVLVSLDDDPRLRMVGNLVAADGDGGLVPVDAATIRIGEPVRVVFDAVEGVPLPRWVRA